MKFASSKVERRGLSWRSMLPIIICLLLATIYLPSLAYNEDRFLQGHDALQVSIYAHHVTKLTIELPYVQRSARHIEEKARLLDHLRSTPQKKGTKSLRDRVLQALHAFDTYKHERVEKYKSSFQSVPPRQQKTLNSIIGYDRILTDLRSLQAVNENICKQIVDSGLRYYGISRSELDKYSQQEQAAGRKIDSESVSQALKLIVRDWAAEGSFERDTTFPCITSNLKKYLHELEHADGNRLEILVPGAGLLRLAHEIAKLGSQYVVTANEWSTYVNAAYHFLEDHPKPHSLSFYPYIDIWSHLKTRDEMRRKVTFPNVAVNASEVLLVEGDFTQGFRSSGPRYHAIVTFFFIDTARNIMSYLDTIDRLLVPGGLWLNFGPLLYGTSPWVQLSLDELVMVVNAKGYEFLETDETCGDLTLPGQMVRSMEAVYNFNSSSLSKYAYMAQFWVVRKPS